MSGIYGFTHYNLKGLPFMNWQACADMPVTEPYVVVPPALTIRDDEGGVWTLGWDYNEVDWRGGRWEYDVVRNGVVTGEFARKIEYRQRKIRIWGSEGWKTWNGRQFV